MMRIKLAATLVLLAAGCDVDQREDLVEFIDCHNYECIEPDRDDGETCIWDCTNFGGRDFVRVEVAPIVGPDGCIDTMTTIISGGC